VSEQSETRRQLEVTLRRVVGDTSQMASGVGSKAKSTAPAVGILAALLAFAWGRRRGRRRQTYVEVRRSK
jgi:hypothetical protein